jgi:predicted sulfurtransferase
MLQKAWLKNTYQLDGWVVKYINTYNDGNWQGSLYVFDDRVSQFVWDEHTHTTIWECLYSWRKTDNCENCRLSSCNARVIAERQEYLTHAWFCSQECADKAIETLIIRTDLKMDNMRYKEKRWVIKRFPHLKKEMETELKTHLMRQLHGIKFNHKKSQKEDFVMD